jgi:hypothetical protein
VNSWRRTGRCHEEQKQKRLTELILSGPVEAETNWVVVRGQVKLRKTSTPNMHGTLKSAWIRTIARAGEIAVRLATIRAAGRWCYHAEVDVSDMEWGRDVVNESIETVTKEATNNMVEEVSHGQLQNKILNCIRKRGGKNVKRRDVMRSLAKSIRNKKDFDAIIDVFEEGGIILVEKEIPPTGGPTVISYSLG